MNFVLFRMAETNRNQDSQEVREDRDALMKTMVLDLASALFREEDIRVLGKLIMANAKMLIHSDRSSLFTVTSDQKASLRKD